MPKEVPSYTGEVTSIEVKGELLSFAVVVPPEQRFPHYVINDQGEFTGQGYKSDPFLNGLVPGDRVAIYDENTTNDSFSQAGVRWRFERLLPPEEEPS